MSLEPLFEDDFWEVHIKWTNLRAYTRVRDEGSEYDDSAHLYYICAQFSSGAPKVLYIGQTYRQSVSMRLRQPDHKNRYAAFIRNYPRHHFSVSHGIVTVTNGRLTKRRIDDTERLLIYANDPEHAYNVKNFYQHGVVTGSYFLINTGHRGSLPLSLRLGVFVEN
ncbi:hypothetical protein MJD09_05795 [bacterium]|nr:hypothetical protein [bacterium]